LGWYQVLHSIEFQQTLIMRALRMELLTIQQNNKQKDIKK